MRVKRAVWISCHTRSQIRFFSLYTHCGSEDFFAFLRRFGKFNKRLNSLANLMVGVAGFEPATPTSRTWCATRLRYTPTDGRSYNPGILKGKLERPE